MLTESKDLIEKINTAKKPEDIISVSNFRDEFRSILKLIHPDVCSLNGAKEATARMACWKDFLENGKHYEDDCGILTTNGYWAEFQSSEPNLQWSFEHFHKLKSMKGNQAEHFNKYIPKELSGQRFHFEKRSIPLSGLTLSQEHVNWVLSRLLEYCAYLEETGWVHCGLSPESVFIIPETHGIQICSFYHCTRVRSKVSTISAKYQNWYPAYLFDTNKAFHEIDIEMAKKIAAYLLGAPSGNAVALRKTHKPEFVNFLVSHHDNAHEALFQYKEILSKNFKKQFHLLTI
jgi:serine/threonine protein kinase